MSGFGFFDLKNDFFNLMRVGKNNLKIFLKRLALDISALYLYIIIKNNIMKITIELTDAEVKGIKAYLKEVDGIDKPNKQDVTMFINSIVQAIHAPQESVSDYIKIEQQKESHYVGTIYSDL